jgi:hypothetical protein
MQPPVSESGLLKPGHAVAMAVEDPGLVHFFDPNVGEFILNTKDRFVEFMEALTAHAHYDEFVGCRLLLCFPHREGVAYD